MFAKSLGVEAAAFHERYCFGMRLPWPVVLASASPRRQELLKQLVPEFKTESADIDETPEDGETPWETAERLARLKAETVSARCAGSLVIAGDTVVAVPADSGHVQLGKPTDVEDAKKMLRTLSGREHLVITGVTVRSPFMAKTFSVTTKVEFRDLTDQEIADYVQTGEPMDKAGAYAIQGGAKDFVAKCDGSVTNVIGFPVEQIESAVSWIAERGSRI
jgi:septum formation protein